MPARKTRHDETATRAPVEAGFVVGEDLAILEFLGQPGVYVEFAPGVASLQLQKVICPMLRTVVVELTKKALSSRKAVHRRGVRFLRDGEPRIVDISVSRTSHPKGGDSCIEIRFEQATGSKPRSKRAATPADTLSPAAVENRKKSLEEEIAALRSELEAAAHDQARGLFAARLRTLEEDREKAVAELEQAYAELEASHEQLQIAVSEREAAELQARDERDFVEAVLDAAHALVVVMDRAGRILRFNRACERAAGRRLSEIRGGLVWNLIPADQRGRVQKVFDDLLAGRYPNQFENEWRRKDGSRVRVSWSNTVLTNAAGSVTHVIGVGIDVTEQRKAEAALRDSDARNLALVEAAPLGIVAIDRSNRIQAVNQALERTFGYERAELLGRTLGMLLPKRFRRVHRGHQESFFEHPVSRPMGVNMSLFGLAKDGREFPIEVGLGHFEATGGPYAVAFVTDVTEKIRAHEMIEKNRDEIRDLAARLMTAREEEQRRIARDLHDGLVQDLVAVKLDLAVLARNPAITAAGVLDDVKRAEEEVRLVAETARTISHELHPAVLDRLGLVPALRSNAAEVQRATGIEVRVEADDPVPELPRRTALGLYRIAQEALWNAVKHSGTDSVTIAVRTAPDDELVLEVTDHGKGFDLADVRRGRSLGLVSMEERTRLIGGNLELQAQPGGGTVVRVRLERNASADRHPGMSELPSKS